MKNSGIDDLEERKQRNKSDFNFKKDNLLNPESFNGYANSISKKIWKLIIELDRMEQVQRIASNRNKDYLADRAIYNAGANAYSHVFDMACEIFELSPHEEFKYDNFEYRLKRSTKLKLYKNEDWLRGKYLGEGLSTCEIAEICNVHRATIKNYIDKFGIKKGRDDGKT